jgi:hypothetical protein
MQLLSPFNPHPPFSLQFEVTKTGT